MNRQIVLASRPVGFPEIELSPGGIRHPVARTARSAGEDALSEVQRLSPPVEPLPEDFRNAFFGGLDHAIFGTKL